MVDAESVAIVEVESPDIIVVVSVDIVEVDSLVDVSSVFGLLWQAAKVNMLPTNNKASAFFISVIIVFFANIPFFQRMQLLAQ